jgi:beta-glucosidase
MNARFTAAIAIALATAVTAATPKQPDPGARAAAILRQMTPAERTVLLHGSMAVTIGPIKAPDGSIPGAGYVPGIARLGVPALTESDASLGVAYALGARGDGATALPSGMALASSWNPQLMREGGAMIGGEAHAKGFNVLLAGGVNLIREPRGGRTFEYLSEDPLLAGTLAGAAVAGIQSAHVISTVKHFALNDEETGRHFHNVLIDDGAARESDLLAFQLAIERGQPGAVMCAYNQINSHYGCGNDWLLNQVLKRDWGYKGWVMSDWGAVGAVDYVLKGLDQQSGEQIDPQVFLGQTLQDLASKDSRYAKRIDDMNQRILRSIFAVGVDANPPQKRPIDFKANGDIAERAARQGIVLLHNPGKVLPLGTVKRIAVIGGYADSGVLAGGGSSQVQGEGGPSLSRPAGGDNPLNAMIAENYQRSVPLNAIRARATGAEVVFRNGRYISDAVIAAKQAEVAIVFATQPMTEGLDVPDLSLPDGQDALIAAVAAANPRTVVVLETGGPVLMPWLSKTAAVMEAWYPGARGAEAITAVLFGDANPSGRLPITFPASETQLPRVALPGADSVEPNFIGNGKPGQTLDINYNVEGADVGYRWYARTAQTPLFAFGHGLSYSTFHTTALKARAGKSLWVECTVHNTGDRSGDDVVQIYLTSAAGTQLRRLIGYQRVALLAGETKTVSLDVDLRLLARWEQGGWHIAAGTYGVAVGRSAADPGESVDVQLAERRWRDIRTPH